MSYILRHHPEAVGLALDASGWVAVDALLAALAAHGRPLTREGLLDLVASSDKQRFAHDPATDRIRANQGHSVEIDLGLIPADPPEVLFHGTVASVLPSIRARGLLRGERHHVHLTAEREVARAVGARRGAPVVVEVRAAELASAGGAFFRTANGVWLVDGVPPAFLRVPDEGSRPGLAARATETLASLEAGFYEGPRGRVEIAGAVARAVESSRVWSPDAIAALPLPPPDRAGVVEVDGRTTLAALQDLAGSTGLACLNFASARNPGGGFATGAVAQEESLARASALVPCLRACPAYYEANRANRSALYLDLVQLAREVPFFRDDRGDWLPGPVLADVITAPAPNAGAVAANEPERAPLVRPTLERRAGLVLRLAAASGARTFVLGAWGCGVFRNDPDDVAGAFAALLADEALRRCFDRLVFAVYDPRPGQAALAAFQRRLGPSGPTPGR